VRTTIGVDGIDALIEGGVPRGASVLISGETGTGKSILCLQFILAGIREGEPGVYVTSDEPGRVFETAASLGWDLRGAVEDGYARVVQALPPGTTVDMPLPPAGAPAEAPAAAATASGPASATIEAVAQAVEELQAERVVIDPAVAPGTPASEATPFVTDLVRGVLARTHCTTLLTGTRPHDAPGYTSLGVEEQLADGVIDLGIVAHDGRRHRVLHVAEMHGTRTDLDDHPFAITAGRGIVVGE